MNRLLEDFSSIWVIFSSHGLVAAHSCSGVPEGGSSAGDGVHGGLASLVREGDPDSSSCQVAAGGCWNNLQDCLHLEVFLGVSLVGALMGFSHHLILLGIFFVQADLTLGYLYILALVHSCLGFL